MNFKVKDLLITVLPEEADRNELCALHTRVCINPTAEPCAGCTLFATCFRTDCGVCTGAGTACLHPTKPGTCCGHCTQHVTCGQCTLFATCAFPTNDPCGGSFCRAPSDDPCGACTQTATCAFPTNDPCGGSFCQVPTDDPCGACTQQGTFCQVPTDDPCGGCTKLGTFCQVPTEDPCLCTHIGTECQFGSQGPCIGGSIGPCLGSREPWIRVRNAEDIAALRESLKATLAKLDELEESGLEEPGAAPRDLDTLEERLKGALKEVQDSKSKRGKKQSGKGKKR